jgi:hypothetical protein
MKKKIQTTKSYSFVEDEEYLKDAEEVPFVSCWINLDDVNEVSNQSICSIKFKCNSYVVFL